MRSRRIRLQHVDRADAPGAPVLVAAVDHVAVVEAVGGRRVHDGGLADAGLVHRGDQRLDGARAFLRPVRALAEQRRRRIACSSSEMMCGWISMIV
jgi:hypothetical protein